MLNWAELREVSKAGIECGAHTASHPQLDILPGDRAAGEIRDSKTELEDRLGRAVSTFAYPHGYASATTRRLVREAGFASACRVRHALSSVEENVLSLSRIVMTEEVDEAGLAGFLSGTGLPVAPPDRLASYGWRIARKLGHLGHVDHAIRQQAP